MTTEELREKLTVAGNMHDGHVTNGSLAKQMKVIEELLRSVCPAFYESEEK